MTQPQDHHAPPRTDVNPVPTNAGSTQPLDTLTPLPDGPNVGPSPQEHLAAQGKTVEPAPPGKSAGQPNPPAVPPQR